MPLIRANVSFDGTLLTSGLQERLVRAMENAGPDARVIVLIHGYKFSPRNWSTSPHNHILAINPTRGDWKAVSWPSGLGVTGQSRREPICIALGWEARGSLWSAHNRAALTGHALADLVARVQALRPRPVDILAHSLGGRVALSAVGHLGPASLGRIVLMAPAAYRAEARRALATEAGQSAEFLHIRTGANRIYDLAFEALIAPGQRGDQAIGRALPPDAANWTEVRLDDPETLDGLARRGLHIAPPRRRICHWAAYAREGVFDLYRALLVEGIDISAMGSSVPRALPRQGLGPMLRPPLLVVPKARSEQWGAARG